MVGIHLPGLAEILLWQAPGHGRLQHGVFLYPEGLSGMQLFFLCPWTRFPKLYAQVVFC